MGDLQEIQSSEGVLLPKHIKEEKQPQLIGDQNDNNYQNILPIPHVKEKQLAKMGLTNGLGRKTSSPDRLSGHGLKLCSHEGCYHNLCPRALSSHMISLYQR